MLIIFSNITLFFLKQTLLFLFPEVYWLLGSFPFKNVIFDGFIPRGTIPLGIQPYAQPLTELFSSRVKSLFQQVVLLKSQALEN